MIVSVSLRARARVRMRTTLGRSQSRSRMLREYLPKWIVESSTDISDEGNVRNSSPLRDRVHLPSTARRIFRSSILIACAYIVGAGFSPRHLCHRGSLHPQSARPLETSVALSLRAV